MRSNDTQARDVLAETSDSMPQSPNKPNQQGPEPIPEFIAHYRILQRLGKGGMGEVFLAEDTKQHGRKVALKVLLRSLTNEPNRIRRFKQEARAVLALNHPNILTIYEIGEWNDSKYKLTLQSDPDFWVAHHYLALAYVQKGMFDEAIAELRSLIKAPPTGPVPDSVVAAETEATASLGFAYAMAGKRNEAMAIIDQLHRLAQKRYVSGLYFAIVYAGLKDNDLAIEYLNKAFETRHPGLVLIRIEPMFDALRSDERFKQLVKRFEPIP